MLEWHEDKTHQRIHSDSKLTYLLPVVPAIVGVILCYRILAKVA